MSGDADSGTRVDREHLRAQAEMERDIRDRNRETRQKDECHVCGDDVPEQDFETKYAAAGGVLAGPFCSSECYWRFMNV